MSFKTPVLYIVFNRLDTVRQTFPRIAACRPENLYVAADGPRADREGEAESCAAVRDYITSRVDWPCSVHTLFRDENLGCKQAVSGAVKWFFSDVDSGIVLEDDILPEPSFFPYCEKMLERYRLNPFVGAVCGFNREGASSFKDDIFLCTTVGVWGWASWADKLRDYSADYSFLYNAAAAGEEIPAKKRMTRYLSRKAESELLSNAKRAVEGELNTWDYQFSEYLALRQMASVVPRKSLVRNLGFSSDSTPTSGRPAWYKDESWDWGGEIRVPPVICLNRSYSRLCEAEYVPKMTFRRRMNMIHDALVSGADRLGLLGGIRWILHHTVKASGKGGKR